jgi:hypothetical protein
MPRLKVMSEFQSSGGTAVLAFTLIKQIIRSLLFGLE